METSLGLEGLVVLFSGHRGVGCESPEEEGAIATVHSTES